VPIADGRIAIILNMKSGSAGRRAERRISDILATIGIEADIARVSSGDVRRRAAAAIAAGFERIVAAGGDGTVGAVAGEVVHSSVSLGVIPLGTFNHFARDAGIPLEVEDALRVIAAGKTTMVDVGDVNGHAFVNNSSLGLYPRLVEERERHRRLGYARWRAFLTAILSTLRRFGLIHVLVETTDFRFSGPTPFVFVGNNEYSLSGLRLGSRDTLQGGRLFVCLAHRAGRWNLLRLALQAFLGNAGNEPGFDVICASDVWVEPRRRALRIALDGEVFYLRGPLHYRVRPAALRVIVP
jgi:diacylglycerol kinase family enzyme